MIFLEPKRLYNGPFDGHHERPIVPWSTASARRGARRPLPRAARRRIGAARRQRTSPCSPTAPWFTWPRPPRRRQGIDAEIIDLRTLLPLDTETIVASVKKTGRCVIVHEATRTSGFGAELMAIVQENCFYHLEAPIERVTGWDTPYPHAQEWDYFPGPRRVGEALEARDGGVRMSERIIKLPDVGEGVAEAEIVELMVKVGEPGARGRCAGCRHDRQGDRRDPLAGRRACLWIGWRSGRRLPSAPR